MGKLSAGAAQIMITPPLGVWMTGFAERPQGCVAVRDDLLARALVLDDGETRVALVTLEVLTLDADLVERVRDLVASRTGLTRQQLLLNYSHTHSGPAVATLRGMGDRDERYCDMLVRRIVSCVDMACGRLRPARLGFATEPVQIGINRRQRLVEEKRTIIGHNPHGPVCKRLDAFKVTSMSGAPTACVFSHATHSVVMGADNLEISGDWPGFACRAVVRWLSQRPDLAPYAGSVMPLFVQGCAGNINPRIRGTYKIAEQLGATVAAAALKAWDLCETVDHATLAARLEVIDVPLQDPPLMGECERQVADWQRQLEEVRSKGGHQGRIMAREGALQWWQKLRELSQARTREAALPYEIFVLRFNADTVVVALAGETFYDLAQDIEARSPFTNTVVLGYSNGLPGGHPGWGGRGAVGYLPPAAAYPDGGYEVEVAIRYYGNLMFAPQAARLVCDRAVEILQSLS